MTVEVKTAGLYNIPEHIYHGDPAPEPSFSSSIGKLILNHSPLHGWMKHPRLNQLAAQDNKPAFDLGSSAHQMLLGRGAVIVRIDAPDFRTKAAREARDEAYSENKTPLLAKQYDEVSAMVESCRRQLRHHEDGAYFLLDGNSEQSAFWQQDGIWCRARFDRVTAQRRIIFDYKTTTDAHPETFLRRVVDLGYDLSAAHYIEGEKAINGHEPQFIFIVQETKPPFAVSVQALTPAFLEIGRMKLERARKTFAWCLEHDKWPAFPNRTAYIDPPGWERQKWLDEHGESLNSNHEEMLAMFRMWEQMQAPGDAA